MREAGSSLQNITAARPARGFNLLKLGCLLAAPPMGDGGDSRPGLRVGEEL